MSHDEAKIWRIKLQDFFSKCQYLINPVWDTRLLLRRNQYTVQKKHF